MHHALSVPEILLRIISHLSVKGTSSTDLAALARTCRTFKELALDALWEELQDLSPLARCLPGACCLSHGFFQWCYAFRRPLNEADWSTLRSYTRRVKYIRRFSGSRAGLSAATELFTPVPFTEPLFPNLRCLVLQDFTTLAVMHVAVKSLTTLVLRFGNAPVDPRATEFLDILADRCPNMQTFQVYVPFTGPLDAAISRQVCLWTNLRRVDCENVALSLDAILHLPYASTLKFTLSAGFDHSDVVFPFPHLTCLKINSDSLEPIARFVSYTQLPMVDDLSIFFRHDASKHRVHEFKAAVLKACRSNTLSHFTFHGQNKTLTEHSRPQLTLDDMPRKAFGDLRTLCINLAWSVNLTDSDLLDLVSPFPRLESLEINSTWGWGTDGGITLEGLVQILRQCPSLHHVALAIDTDTFTRIPGGLDVSFPPRQSTRLNLLDSYIDSVFVPDLVTVFKALGLASWSLSAGVSGGEFDEALADFDAWELVFEGIEDNGTCYEV